MATRFKVYLHPFYRDFRVVFRIDEWECFSKEWHTRTLGMDGVYDGVIKGRRDGNE